jgi:hypothetical protein
VYHIMANDFGLTTRTGSNCGSAAQLVGHPLRGTGLMEAALKADVFEKTMLPDYAAYDLTYCLTWNEHEARDTVQRAYLRAFRFFNTVPQLSFDEIHGPAPGPRLSRLSWSKVPDSQRYGLVWNRFPLSSARSW